MPSWEKRQTSDGIAYYLDAESGAVAWEPPVRPSAGHAADERWCWIEDATHGWLPAKRDGGDAVVLDGQRVAIGSRRTLPLDRTHLDRPSTDDLVYLPDISEPFISHTLRGASRLRRARGFTRRRGRS